jgi:hypothetical protein
MSGIEFYGEIVLPFLFVMAMAAVAIATYPTGRNGR